MIEFRNVSQSYKDHKVLTDINMTIQSGEFVVLIGSSGCGKTTLLKTINKLTSLAGGDLLIDGVSIRDIPDIALRRRIGYVIQDGGLFPHLTVEENISLLLETVGMLSDKIPARVDEVLEMVNLDPDTFRNSFPAQLSGGQKQRVAIARAMSTNPKVLLCDEATSALDPNTTKSILELLKKINRELGITVIVITHEMAVIESICDRVAIIDHSHIAESGKVSEIFSGPKSEIGRQLILGETAGQKTSFARARQIRVIFNGQESSEPIISNMVLACKVPVNILLADTHDIGGKAMGQMLLQLPEDEVDAGRICNYLKTVGVTYEEVR